MSLEIIKSLSAPTSMAAVPFYGIQCAQRLRFGCATNALLRCNSFFEAKRRFLRTSCLVVRIHRPTLFLCRLYRVTTIVSRADRHAAL